MRRLLLQADHGDLTVRADEVPQGPHAHFFTPEPLPDSVVAACLPGEYARSKPAALALLRKKVDVEWTLLRGTSRPHAKMRFAKACRECPTFAARSWPCRLVLPLNQGSPWFISLRQPQQPEALLLSRRGIFRCTEARFRSDIDSPHTQWQTLCNRVWRDTLEPSSSDDHLIAHTPHTLYLRIFWLPRTRDQVHVWQRALEHCCTCSVAKGNSHSRCSIQACAGEVPS